MVSDDPLFTLNQDGSDPKKWYLVVGKPLDYESQQSIAKTQWNLTLTADDSASGGGNDTQSLVINLQEVNEPPVISFGSSTIQRTMSEDGNPTGWPGLSLSASDPEGDQISGASPHPRPMVPWETLRPPVPELLSISTVTFPTKTSSALIPLWFERLPQAANPT